MLQTDPVILDMDKSTLSQGDKSERLRPQDKHVMNVLATTHTASIAVLEAVLFTGRDVANSDRMVKMSVCRLRQHIKRLGLPVEIRTIWGYGYNLTAPVNVVSPNTNHAVIPSEMIKRLEELLYSHPNRASADRVLASIVRY